MKKRILLAAACLALVAGCSVATEVAAWRYGFSPALGLQWERLYAPWSVFVWCWQWYTSHPQIYQEAASSGLTAALVLFGLVGACVVKRNPYKVNPSLHGSARWAVGRDLKRAGLLADRGVYLGAWSKGNKLRYLRGGAEHVLVVAPTGSGKSVSVVIPTLLSWTESAFILDLKGELWALSAGWRQKHAKNKVLRFEPAASAGSVCFNPLDEIRIGTQYEVGDAQNISLLLVDPDGKGLNDHWQKTAQSLLVGCILYLCIEAKRREPATLPGLDRMLADPARDVGKLWKEMNAHRHPVVAAAGRDMIDRPDMEAGSVLSTAKSYLSLYRDPTVAANVSCSDFSIADLMHHESPVSLYVLTEATDKVRLRPLVRILANLVLRRLASGMKQAKPTYRHKLLLMLDEFPSLGRLAIMEEALAFIRGYGIQAMLVTQDLTQLRAAYSKDESITGNCGIQIAFTTSNLDTAEHFSKMTGISTMVREQVTRSGRMFATNISRSMQESSRPLLTADEIMRMPGPQKDAEDRITKAGDVLIFANGFPAIRGRQSLYFFDPTFQDRAAVASPETSSTL